MVSPVLAGIRQALSRLLGWPHLLRRMQISTIAEYVEARPSYRMLDVGCGNGRMASLFRTSRLVVGCDVDSAVFNVTASEKLCAVQGSGLCLPFRDKSFDRVILSSVIQMIPEGHLMLREARRVLKDDGAMVITVPARYRFIPMLFGDSWLPRFARSTFRLPSSYMEFIRSVLDRFKATGRGFFSAEELEALLFAEGLVIHKREYSPKAWGSFVYEMLLIMKYSMGKNLSVAGKALMTFYPIVWFDRWLPKRSLGCELIIKAKKA